MRSLPLVLLLTGLASAAPDPAPPPEVVTSSVKVDLPAVPAFDVPPAVDGVHRARELRVAGKPLLGKDVKVSGYVVWIYWCTNPDKAKCDQPRFSIGELADTPPENAVSIVEVPHGTKLAVGDYVTVTGKFATTSPRGARNSEGLVVFASVAKTSPTSPLNAVSDEQAVQPLVALKPRPKKAIGAKQQNESADHLTTANKLGAAGKMDEAIAEYGKATAAWPDNHLAWYGLATMHLAKGAWEDAAKALDEAVSLRPDVALYLMWRGVAGYEIEMKRGDAAEFDQAASYLRRAIEIAPNSWRAQWTLGRIERATGHPRRAADDFSKTIIANPAETNPYIALAELYRKWDYGDQAIAVAQQGTANAAKVGDLWYVLGMAYERRSPEQAIDAFTKAIDGGKAPATAVYERGRMEFAKKDYASAKRDLEAYLKVGPKGAFEVDIAAQLLGQIPAKH